MRSIAMFGMAVTIWLSMAGVCAAQGTAAAEGSQAVIGSTIISATDATISGVAVTPAGDPLANATVRARNLVTGEIDGSTSTASTGRFAIRGLEPGSYVLEVVDRIGQIIGTSPFVSAAAGSAVAVTVTVTTGMLTAVSGLSGLAATLGVTTAESLKFAAAAAGVAGVVAPVETQTASPSR